MWQGSDRWNAGTDYKGEGIKYPNLPGSGRQKGSDYYHVCRNMCKERKIPEILICSPCDAVTEEDAEKEYELRKHYKRVFRRGESKCCTFQYIAFAIDNSNMSDALFRKSLQKSMAKSCDIVIVCGDVITPNMKEQIEEAKQYHKEIYRMIEKEDGACIFCYQDKEEADEKQICQNSL